MKKLIAFFMLAIVGLAVYAVSAMTTAVAPLMFATSTPANSFVAATIQIDQYRQAAEATATFRQATLEADYRNVAATAQSGTTTAVALTTAEAQHFQATMLAATATIEYQRTRDDLMMAITRDAATAQAQAVADVATATAQFQATRDSFLATRQAIEVSRIAAAARRESVMAMVTAVVGMAAVILVIGLVILFLWRVIPTLVNRASVVRYGQHKNPLFLIERNGNVVVSDPLAMLQAALTISDKGEVTMPDLTPDELQILLAGGRLRMLMEQVRIPPRQLPAEVTTQRRLGQWESHKSLRYNTPPPVADVSYPLAPPSVMSDMETVLPTNITWAWLLQHRGDGLAIGAGHENRIIAVDLAKTPHLFAAGMSGSGKTRRFLRPLVAQALANGFYAVLMNESGSDFMPFYDHANVRIIRGAADDYMTVFEMAIDEMTQREQILRQHRVSEWRRLPAGVMRERPLMLLAIDELLALAMLLSPSEQKSFWGLLAAFASRARKVGMCSVALATDPTYRALGQGGLNYRSQCGRVSFRMIQAAGSRAILDETGAEALGDGAFMALLDRPGVITGMAANPSDDDLRGYLRQQPATHYSQPLWLPVTTSSHQQQPVVAAHNHPQPPDLAQPQPVVPLDATRPPTADERKLIRTLYHELGSKNGVCKRAYGFKDGKVYAWVSAAIDNEN